MQLSRNASAWRAARLLSLVLAGGLWGPVWLRAADPIPGDRFVAQQWYLNANSLGIMTLARTPDGYLWVGTTTGLVRFDGARFVTLTTNTTPALGDNAISSLFTDTNGDLWIGTFAGTLARRHAGTFTALPADASLRDSFINGILREPRGQMLLATARRGLVRYAGGPVETLMPRGGANDRRATIAADRQGGLWGIVNGQLVEATPEGWGVPADIPAPAMAPLGLTPARDGGLWVATSSPQYYGGRGTRIYKLKDRRWQGELSPYPWVQTRQETNLGALAEDAAGRVWAALNGAGVYVWEPGEGWRRPVESGLAAQIRAMTLLADAEGSVWVGGYDGEPCQLRPREVSLLKLPPGPGEHSVQTVCATRDGALWLGTDGAGAYRHHEGHFTHFGAAEGLTNQDVRVWLEDRQSQLWAGTLGGLFVQRGDRFEPAPGAPALRGVVLTLCEDHAGHLWVGSFDGIVRLGADGVKVFGRAEGVDHNFVRGLAEDTAGRLWLAMGDRGLYRLQGERFEPVGAGQFPGEVSIHPLHADRAGALWIGTYGSGFTRWQAGRYTVFGAAAGLPALDIEGITEDGAGNLWFSSCRGVFGAPRARLSSRNWWRTVKSFPPEPRAWFASPPVLAITRSITRPPVWWRPTRCDSRPGWNPMTGIGCPAKPVARPTLATCALARLRFMRPPPARTGSGGARPAPWQSRWSRNFGSGDPSKRSRAPSA